MTNPDTVEGWTPGTLLIDPGVVLRLAGYRRPAEAPAPVREAARQAIGQAQHLASVRGLVRRVPVTSVTAASVALSGGVVFSGRAVAGLLADCGSAVLFALSLGPRLETLVATLGDRRELLEAYFLDTAGWAALEAAARALRNALAARLRSCALRPTHRLGPGHRDWPLGEQEGLLALLEGGRDVVRLSPYGVLVPFKSVSGVFGLRPDGAGTRVSEGGRGTRGSR